MGPRRQGTRGADLRAARRKDPKRPARLRQYQSSDQPANARWLRGSGQTRRRGRILCNQSGAVRRISAADGSGLRDRPRDRDRDRRGEGDARSRRFIRRHDDRLPQLFRHRAIGSCRRTAGAVQPDLVRRAGAP